VHVLDPGATDPVLAYGPPLNIARYDFGVTLGTDGYIYVMGGVTSAGIGQPVDLELYSTTGGFRENEPWGEVQKVAYQLRLPEDRLAPGKDLVRCVTRNLLAIMTPQPEDQLMMGGVDSIEFSCFDGASWNNSWDSTLTTNLPTAVRVRILLANPVSSTGTPRPCEILVPIVSQTRTNQNT